MTAVQPENQTAAAERRPVSVLFADVVDSTSLAERMDPEDWSGAMRSVLGLMSAPVERYGGRVARLMGDGLLAIFGAPAAHEDDAVRAVQAGLDMIESVAAAGPELRRQYGRELGDSLRIRVGVNTGLAIVEGMGGGAHEVDALGDTVNVAARMQNAARPGTVLVTGETWRYAGPTFEATSLGGVQVKGKAEPVDAWEVVGRQDQPGSGRGLAGLTSAMVGRDQELDRLLALVSAIRAGRGRAAILLGEPGVGKSRLLAELRARYATVSETDIAPAPAASTERGAARWVEARCASYGENVPHGVLGELAAACLGLPSGASSEDRRQVLEERSRGLFGEAWQEPYVSLAHLLSLPLAPEFAEQIVPLSPQALLVRYAAALELTVRRLCEVGSTIVVIEDVHWADASSVEIIGRLLPLAHELPVLLMLTSRPERTAVGWRLVEAARETFGDALSELPLSPLQPAESRLLVSNLLEIESLPERLRASILDRAEGNPFFVEELIRMLIERGWVVRSGAHWVASGTVAQAEVPDTLRGLLLARIDRLPDEARRTLRMASVIGRDVAVRLLEGITGDPAATARALGQGEAAGLVRFAAADPEPVYRFRHVLIQEAAYDSLLKADRRRLHRQVGEALEAQQGGDRREELAPILGLHFERAGDAERAVEYLHMAGRQALRSRALEEARELLNRAAAVLDDAPETPEVDRRRIEVAIDRAAAGFLSVPLEEDLAILADAQQRAERLGDERLLGLVLAREAGSRAAAVQHRDPEALVDIVERAMEIGQRLGEPEILALPRALHGLSLMGQGRRREAIGVLEEAVDLLERFVVNEASFYAGQLAIAHAQLGDFEEATHVVERARALADRSGDPRALADADIFEGFVLGLQGRNEEAAALARRGAQTAEAYGEVFCQSMACFVAGDNELALKRALPAIEWLDQAKDLAVRSEAGMVERWSSAALKTAHAMAGEGAAALSGMDLLVEQAREAGDPLEEALVLMRRAGANAALPSGDRELARADTEAAMVILRRLEVRPYLEQAEQLYSTLS
ncbi:MAG: AAA family ATPase [Chloroflexi bacterium]|nr:AAA family ATPase [Chloroflexota bacterium]